MNRKLLALLLALLSYVSYGQSTIRGKILDEHDAGLPGVNVVIKGTTQGTVTDVNGAFKLENVPVDGTLVISFIGYVTQEIAVVGQTLFSVKLQPDIKALDEVVVIGYGTATKKEVTGAIAGVNGEDLTSLNTTRIDQALQGQVAGVSISTASGSPGGGSNIRIRGLSTNGDNNPLILVDGVPYSSEGLNALNPSDIESINVLKDATAGIYGVRAANGVVIITTKQGKRNGKPTLEVSGYYGVQETTKKLDLLNAREYAILKNEAFAAGGQAPIFNNYELGKGTDWQDEVFQTAPIQNYNLSVNGGSDKSNYSIGGSYLDQKGIVGGDKSSFRRYNARINFTTDLSQKVSLQNVFLYTHERRKSLYENGIGSVLFNTINASPAASVRDENGKFTLLEEVSEVINPLAQIENTYNETHVNKVVGKQELTYKINEKFELSGRIGYNYANVDTKNFFPYAYYGSSKSQNTVSNPSLVPDSTELFSKEVGGVKVSYKVLEANRVHEEQSTFFNYNAEAFLNFKQLINETHNLKGTAGISYFGDQGKTLGGTAYNIPYNSWEFADISLADKNHLKNDNYSSQFRSRLQSYFVRGEYGFKNKYLFSGILRRDASSRFGKNNRSGFFPSLSGAWVVSEEAFFISGLVQFFKVRGSYGVSGNDRIGDFRYTELLKGEGVYPFNDQLTLGAAVGVPGNQDLKWETTSQSNFGLDLNLLSDKVSISADYYIKTTRDLLSQPDVSALLGGYGAGEDPPFINAGDVRNSGFEFLINYSNQLSDNFKLNINYTLTTVKNEVLALPYGVDFYSYGAFSVGAGNYATRMEKGYPLGYFFGYKTDGVYQSDAEVASRGVTQQGAEAGDLRFVDVSGDGNINFSDNSDKTMIGSPFPDFTMGLGLGFNVKGFDFSTMIYTSIGNEILRNYERQQPRANSLGYVVDRWTGEGSTSEHPRLSTAASKNGVLSDYYVEDGSFVRIKNIQLGYSFPSSMINGIGITKIRIYVAANNVFTFTKYMGYDPDFLTGSAVAGGIDYGFYPQARTVMTGINLTF